MELPKSESQPQKATPPADALEKMQKKEWEQYGYPVEDDECDRSTSNDVVR